MPGTTYLWTPFFEITPVVT